MIRYRLRAGVEFDGPDKPAAGFNAVAIAGTALGPVWLTGAQLATIAEPIPVPVILPPPSPAPGGTEFGAWFAGDESADVYRAIAATGCKWARLRWCGSGATVEAHLQWLDRMVANAEAAGLKILLEWWWHAAPGTAGDMPTVTVAEWRALATTLAKRYGKRIGAWQPGNEMDLWRAQCPDWPPYVIGAAEAIRAVLPAAYIVAPGLCGEDYALGGKAERDAQARRVTAILPHVNALAVHCYAEDVTRTWGSVAGKVTWLRSMAGGWAGPVWLTEFGGISAPASQWWQRSEALQASQAQSMVAGVRAAGVPAAFWYSAVDRPDQAERHGLMTGSGAAKPALAAFASAIGSGR